MLFEQRVMVPAAADAAWQLVVDIPAVSRCVPGVDGVRALDPTTHEGALRTRVGPIAVRLEGRVALVERDDAARRAVLDVRSREPRLNSTVSATTTLTVSEAGPGACHLAIRTEATILGRLGELGQGIVRRKADQILAEFATNFAAELGGG